MTAPSLPWRLGYVTETLMARTACADTLHIEYFVDVETREPFVSMYESHMSPEDDTVWTYPLANVPHNMKLFIACLKEKFNCKVMYGYYCIPNLARRYAANDITPDEVIENQYFEAHARARTGYIVRYTEDLGDGGWVDTSTDPRRNTAQSFLDIMNSEKPVKVRR